MSAHYNYATVSRPTPWAWMFVATFAVTLVTLLVFGVLGGLTLLIGMNGVSGSTGGIVLLVYAIVVLAGNFAVAALLNWFIARQRYAGTRAAGWAPVLVALGVTAATAVIGPPLAVGLIKLMFAAG